MNSLETVNQNDSNFHAIEEQVKIVVKEQSGIAAVYVLQGLNLKSKY